MTAITASLQLDDASAPVEVATLYSRLRRRTVSSTLRYNDDYVAAPTSYSLEPALPLTAAAQPLDGVLPR